MTRRNFPWPEGTDDDREDKGNNKISAGDCKCEQQQTGCTGHTDCRNKPDGRGGRKALNAFLPHKDEPRSNKTDSGDNLCRNTGWVEHNTAFCKNVRKAVL